MRRGRWRSARLAELGLLPAGATSPTTEGFGVLSTILEREGRGSRLRVALERAGWAMTPERFTLGFAVAALAASVLGGTVLGPLGVPAAVATTGLGTSWALRRSARRRRDRFVDELPDVLTVMAASLRSGHGLYEAVRAAAADAPDPAGGELRRVVLDVRAGGDLGRSFHALGERVDCPELRWAVDAITISQDVGGELAETLLTVAATVRERRMLRRRVQAVTAEGRLSVVVMSALPPAVVVATALLDATSFERLTTGSGRGFLLAAGVLELGGLLWMRRLVAGVVR